VYKREKKGGGREGVVRCMMVVDRESLVEREREG